MFLFIVVYQLTGSLKFKTEFFHHSSDVEYFSKTHHVIDVIQYKFSLNIEHTEAD